MPSEPQEIVMDHPSTLLLQRWRHGELDADASSALRAHLDACPRCRQRWASQERTAAEIVARPVPEAIAALSPKPRRPWWTWLAGGVSVLAAASALMLVLPSSSGTTSSGTRAKGVLPDVELWVASDAGPRPLRDGEAVHAGETVQLKFDAHGARHVTLAGMDATGAVEIYGDVTPGPGLQAAPFALTLDDAPGPQAFFVVPSDAALPGDAVEKAVRSGDPSVTKLVVPKE